MFKRELETRGERPSMSYEKENAEFHKHSRTGAMFGKPELSPEMAKAVSDYYQKPGDELASGKQVDLKASVDVNEDEVLGNG